MNWSCKYLRWLLDGLGVLMLLQLGFVAVVVLSYSWREQEDSDQHVALPDSNEILRHMELGNPADWLLQGELEQQRCSPSTAGYLVHFQRRAGAPRLQLGKSWQHQSEPNSLHAIMLEQLQRSPCRPRWQNSGMSTRLPMLWLRVREAHWRDGRLSDWTLFLYDARSESLLVWQLGWPA